MLELRYVPCTVAQEQGAFWVFPVASILCRNRSYDQQMEAKYVFYCFHVFPSTCPRSPPPPIASGDVTGGSPVLWHGGWGTGGGGDLLQEYAGKGRLISCSSQSPCDCI